MRLTLFVTDRFVYFPLFWQKSTGCVTKTMIYRYLTNEGIQYLRDYLHLPSEIVPSTLKRALPRGDARPARTAAPRPGGDKPEGDRAAYRYTRLFPDLPFFLTNVKYSITALVQEGTRR